MQSMIVWSKLAVRPSARVLLWLWPWLAAFATAAALAGTLTMAVAAGSDVPPRAMPTSLLAVTVDCDTTNNVQLAYAISTHRLPEDYCERPDHIRGSFRNGNAW